MEKTSLEMEKSNFTEDKNGVNNFHLWVNASFNIICTLMKKIVYNQNWHKLKIFCLKLKDA